MMTGPVNYWEQERANKYISRDDIYEPDTQSVG